MDGGYVDLHIHSYYSDGTMSPLEIAQEAERRGMSLIAVCDHNVLEGSRQLIKLCRGRGLSVISGVEIDSLEDGVDHHILGYGVDLYEPEFTEFIKRNRELLDDISVKLIRNMSKDYTQVSLEDYDAFTYDRRLGGWRGMHYLYSKGLADSFAGVRKYYDDYDCPFSVVDFPSVPDIVSRIHKAGGRAVLAHPGETMKHLCTKDFAVELERLVSFGLDGVECYYTTHSAEVTERCTKLCREKGLLITAGSDCHGSFGKTHIGQVKATCEMLSLKGLV